jgi:hypothetical protein
MAEYQPGVCNLNTAETDYRRKAGHFMAVVSFIAIVLLIVFKAHGLVRFIVLAPLIYLTAISYLQAKNKFCVQYAATGKQNTDEDSKSAVIIEGTDEKTADKTKAKKMHIQAVSIGIFIAAIIALLTL